MNHESGNTFSTPIRVNSQSGSAIGTGTVRGAQLATGKDKRVHVAWNVSSMAEPKGTGGTPMLYTHLNDEGTAFEPQRNLITWASGIDGGGTIAADTKGDVYVAWHTLAAAEDEAGRAVYLARSEDNGQTFAREKKINPQPTGACGGCQMRVLMDDKGVLYVPYRAAGNNVERDFRLLVSCDTGSSFQGASLQPWNIAMCPMSSFSMAQNKTQLMAAVKPATTTFQRPLPLRARPTRASTRLCASTPTAKYFSPGPKAPARIAAARWPGRFMMPKARPPTKRPRR